MNETTTTTKTAADRIEWIVDTGAASRCAFLLSESGLFRIASLGDWLGDCGWVNSTCNGVEVTSEDEWAARVEALAARLIATDEHR